MGSLVSAIGGGSKKAAKAKSRAIEDSNKYIKQAAATNIGELEPIAQTGIGGLNKLAMYLGIPGAADAVESEQNIADRLGIQRLPSGEFGNLGRARIAEELSKQAAVAPVDESTNPLYGSLLKPFTGEDLVNTPGYQFGLEQGQQGIDRRAAQAGNLLSGAALKAATRFGQDYAGTKFQEGYNRDALDKSRISDFLGSVANMGVNTRNNIANIRTGAAGDVARGLQGMGEAKAAGILGQEKAWANVADTGAQLAMMAATGGMGGLGGLGAGASSGMMGAGGSTLGGMASQGAMQGFSQNMLNPNFAQNYMGKF